MAGGLLAGALGLGKTLGVGKAIGGLFGGGGGEPNPETANNLAQALSYMDRLDDMNKAAEIAQEMIKRGAAGESYNSVAAWADRQAGYNDGGPFTGIYPWDLIKKHYDKGVRQLKQMQRESQQSQQAAQSSAGGGSGGGGAGGAAQAGMMATLQANAKLIAGALVALMLGYLVTQK